MCLEKEVFVEKRYLGVHNCKKHFVLFVKRKLKSYKKEIFVLVIAKDWQMCLISVSWGPFWASDPACAASIFSVGPGWSCAPCP